MQVLRHNKAHLVCAAALCLTLLAGPAAAAPADGQSVASDTQAVGVTLRQPSPSVTTSGDLQLAVNVTLTAPAEYLEVRLRLRRPGGRLVYQKTEVRTGLGAGTHIIEYEHELGGLDLEKGRYPIDVRVLATGSTATTVQSRLLVTEPGDRPLPVAIVVSVASTPVVTGDGRFAADPAQDTNLRDDLAFVTQLAANRRLPLALAIPPVLVEQLGRVEGGYETSAGVSVAAGSDTSLRASRTLDALRSALTTGTIEMVDVPYALPDIGHLARISAVDDLSLHWSRADAANASVLRAPGDPGVAYVGPVLTDEVIDSLEQRGVGFVLAPPSAITSSDATPTPGGYELSGEGVRVLAVDEEAARGAAIGSEEFYDALFKRLDRGDPVVIMLEVGSGDPISTVAVQHAFDWIEDASWLRLKRLGSFGAGDAQRQARVERLPRSGEATEYWAEVAQGRRAGLRYVEAVGLEDPDALAVLRGVLLSESSLFPASRGDTETGYDGRTFAREVTEFVTAQFALVRLDAKDVTLSGTRGDVPLTVVNDTGKRLRLTLNARSAAVLNSPSQAVDIQPTQNFLTVPIDLGNALSDTLRVEVMAGDLAVTDITVEVRASYMDRLAIVVMVILVLGGLLLFIRKRVKAADADTIVADRARRDSGT